jgi:Fe-S cluster assembly iron-binding protein IscA
VDYSDDLIRSGFRFTNPHAKGSCGCGASFAA